MVRGRVQGVGFRHFVVTTARRLGVTGWVRNLADGSVEIWAEGEAADLETLDRALRRGPAGSVVQGVERSPGKPSGGRIGFEIRWDGD